MTVFTRRNRRPRAATAMVSVAAALLFCAATPARAAAPLPTVGSGPGGYQLEISQGKSQVLEVPAPYTDLMVADPKVADVVPLTSHSVYVVGKGPGATGLTIYGAGKRLIAAVNVVVGPDIDSFKVRLHEIMPDEKDIFARAANQSLVVSGTASSPSALSQVLALAETYAPTKVVNMLGVEGTQQVMLSVRFVEMERSAAKSLNISVNRTTTSGNPQFQFGSGEPMVNAFGVAALNFLAGDGNLNVELDALETRGLIKTLAEPTLVAMSGDTASFLAGGELPIPVAQTTNSSVATITVEFKQFGISLAFTPTILKDGLINLVVKPEVSSLDPANSVTSLGLVIPGLKVRRASTTIEMRDGESFTIAGLLASNYQNNVAAFPVLGDVPILGALFRSPNFKRDETELVIVVTPHLATPRRGPVALPTDHFVPPSDYELFMYGMQLGKSGDVRPEDRALMSRDPTKGGVEGPYGHVLY